jgi:hypothetical protein
MQVMTRRKEKVSATLTLCVKALKTRGTAELLCMLRRMRLVLLIMGLGVAAVAQGQSYYFVDCSGTNPADYSTISAALAVAGPNSYVLITGACNENVNITNAWNLNIGAPYGSTASINGNVSVTGSNTVFLYGLNVTNPAGDAFDITSSRNVTLWTCTGNENHGRGLMAENLSDVTVEGPGSFDNNGTGGINLSGNASVSVQTWGGPLDISRNQGPGVWLTSGSVFETLGNTTINNNVSPSGAVPPTGYGIQALGASKVQIGTCYGSNQIAYNQSGGVDAEENSEVSLWSCGAPYQSSVIANGPVGISAGLGSQVTLYDNAQISEHTGSGVELYGNSQLRVFSANLISQNGSAGDPRSAGIVVDGNSEAYLRGGTISSNEGPGILALVNSSVDSVGATFSGNIGGIATCDSSAYMVSDLLPPTANPPPGIACRSPHHLGNRRGFTAAPAAPDATAQKNKALQYKALATLK